MLFRKTHPSINESVLLSGDEESDALLNDTINGFIQLSKKCDDLIMRIRARKQKANTGVQNDRQQSQH